MSNDLAVASGYKYRHLLGITLVVAAATSQLACGGSKASSTPAAPPVTQASGQVGTAAATITVPGTATLQTRVDTLPAGQTVTVAAVTAPVPTPKPVVSKVVEFTPHGIQFASPVTISLNYASGYDPARLSVLRLPSPAATTWELVGGVTFSGGLARLESTTFSYYAVVDGYTCTPVNDSVACSASCECCGGATCVDLATDQHNCGACGNDCGSDAFCASGGTCVPLATTDLCDNSSAYAVMGEVPADLVYVDPKQTLDGIMGADFASAFAAQCGVTPVTVSQAQTGILDPCTDAPLIHGANTILLVGGGFGQRLARYLDRTLAPISMDYSSVTGFTFKSRAGNTVASFADTRTPTHDYFIVALDRSDRGALIVQVWGLGWEGTPAGVWYFKNQLLPEFAGGTRTWQRYRIVEWTKNPATPSGTYNYAVDTFSVLVQDTQ